MDYTLMSLKEGVLPIGEALRDAGIVILVVFGVLFLMYILISLAGKILQSVGSTAASDSASKTDATVTADAAAPEIPEEEFSSGTLRLKGCDEKTAAMIMAIVSDNTGIPLNELIFKSITLVEEK